MSGETVYEHYDMLGVIKARVTEERRHGHSVFHCYEGYGQTRSFIRLGAARLYLENKYI